MPKLAIYVPKKEMRELEKWRKKINFSQVFMQAVMREIRERSRLPRTSPDALRAAAEHYRRELAESSGSLVDFGFQLGSRHVLECRLRSELIRKLLEIESPEAATAGQQELIEQAMGEDVKSMEELFCRQGIDDRSHPTGRAAVQQGYVKGVAAAWQKVCQQMKETG